VNVPMVIANLSRVGALRGAKAIAQSHGLTLAEVLSADRHASVARARQHLIAVTTWTLGLSYTEAGALFGMHHTTVIDHAKAWERRITPTAA
jgi:chromosomal replication initiation ATPase DnaA